MYFYICSTPYHVLLSLCNIFLTKKKSVLYLSTHDNNSFKIFLSYKENLKKLDLISEIYIRKRNKKKEKIKIESIKDRIEYIKIKPKLSNSKVYNFAWNAYSLYTTSNFLYKKSNIVFFIEEGAYQNVNPKPSKLILFIKKYIYGISTDFYKDEKLKKILVQYPEKYPKHLIGKIEKFDVNLLFNRLTKYEIQSIVKIFLSDYDIEKLINIKSNKSIIILTQPLSEDGFISENEKVNLYKKIIDKYNNYSVVIKKHPREKTNYCFENVTEIEGAFPSEIFSFIGIRFNKAIGICTSAITLIDADEKVNLDEDFLKKNKR
ncbi:glycosyltransferase family 52 protein [Clostridium caldaquaticum]|uniref:glycosyltransferase family 52 protein n=1 Tax=Clostridium caldaquaticum TaxID=2940653 RepID=UPI002076EDDC|nr:glycosyltransferase family 52 protein [Clostridium caldaquaticum]